MANLRSGVSVLLALCLTSSVFAATAAQADPSGDGREPVAPLLAERDDALSAMVTAGAQGERVEDLSARSETVQRFANPDGTWTTEEASGPVRVLDEDGEWHDVDTTLVEVDGGIAPLHASTDVQLSAGGDRDLVTVRESGQKLRWRWASDLPVPMLEGNVATYEDAVEGGGDLVVEVTPTGFAHFVVLHDAPDDAVSFDFPVASSGVEIVHDEESGAVDVVNGAGESLLGASAPLMWDSSVDDGFGDPKVVELATEIGETSKGNPVVTLTPDPEFLADPETVYPVIIDPAFTTEAAGDVWVQNKTYTTGQVSSPELRAGTPDAGSTVARSFINFGGGLKQWGGHQILSSTLYLRNFSSANCGGSRISARRVTEAWTGGTMTWANKPAGTTSGEAISTQAFGASGCGNNGWMTWNVKDITQAWSTGGAGFHGFLVRATEESATVNPYRRFRSANYADHPLMQPKLVVNSNRYPRTPGKPTVVPAVGSFTNSTGPKLSAVVSDPDLGKVSGRFELWNGSTKVWTGTSSAVSSGGTATVQVPAGTLQNGQTYTVRVWGVDPSGGVSASWSSATTVTVDTTAPTVTVTASDFSKDSWAEPAPASNTFTLTGPSDTSYFSYSQDGGTFRRVAASSGTATVAWAPQNGWHALSVRAVDRADNTSALDTFEFGSGGALLSTDSDVARSTDSFTLNGSGPDGASGAKVQWRYASETAWNDAVEVDSADGGAWSGVVNSDGDASLAQGLVWKATTEEVPDAEEAGATITAPALLETRICFTYASATDVCSAAKRLQLVEHAFGSWFPVTQAGPGDVALWTGEFTASDTDVDVATYSGSMSVSRTHSSYAGPRSPEAAVFGPGWTASFEGSGAGASGMQLLDNTMVDGTLVLNSAEGDAMVFAPAGSNWTTRTSDTLATGEWIGVDEDTPKMGVKATVGGTSSAPVFTLTDDAGGVTVFTATKAPGAGAEGAAQFAVATVTELGGAGTTRYTHDGSGRVTRILAALPEGMTGADCSASSWAKGCRALEIEYATATTASGATAGDVSGQVKAINLRVHDGGGNPGETRTLVTYEYDAGERLVTATDALTSLSTTYGYDAENRLTRVTEPGLAPYQLEYENDRLSRVKRANPSTAGGGTATLATIVYGVRPWATQGSNQSPAEGLPDLTFGSVSAWDQGRAPTYGAAVFGPDKPITETNPSEVSSLDWQYAGLWFTDYRGALTNTAVYGADEWQISATDYDEHRNVVRQLDAGDIQGIRAGTSSVAEAGTITVYNDSDNGPSVLPAGTVVTDVYEPARTIRAEDGSTHRLRPHTKTRYDEGAPNSGINPDTGAAWAMPTSELTRAVNPTTLESVGAPTEASQTEYGATVDQWKLGQPISVRQLMNGTTPDASDIITTTEYDTQGRVTANRQPMSTGSDAGTRKTAYYTADGSSEVTACRNQPVAAGAVCRTYYAAAPSSGPVLPVVETTDFDKWFLSSTTQTETAGTAARTTTTEYDAVTHRVTKTWMTATGFSDNTPAPGSEYEYDSATGAVTGIWPLTSTGARDSNRPKVTNSFDDWGRSITYSPAPGETTTTAYDAQGRVASVADPKGTTTHTYDGTDAAGQTERRGLVTKTEVSSPQGTLTFKGAYDADSALTLETLPGGMSRRVTLDEGGNETAREYVGPTVDGDEAWLSWATDYDITGRVVREWTPQAAAYVGNLANGSASAYARRYEYDRAQRLVKVTDHTALNAASYDEDGGLVEATCQVRLYGFDKSGNRTNMTRRAAAANGSCTTSGGTTKTWNYDTADRITTGYVYDAFGRATTVPHTDTPAANAGQSSSGNVAIAYTATDQVKSIAQGGVTTAFALDSTGRRSSETITGGTAPRTLTRHYTDAADNPTWVVETAGSASTTTRYVPGLSGDLAATITTGTNAGIALTVVDPHGDTPATITVPETGNATGIGAWVDTDEYGNPTTTGADIRGTVTKGAGYGWLGGKERATTDSGLILMGARLYNRATGQFTSMDPVYGGNTTSYTYPQDPINDYDITGLWCSRCKKAWKRTTSYVSKHKTSLAIKGAGIVGGVACGASVICGVAVGVTAGVGTYVAKSRENRKPITVQGVVGAAAKGALASAAGKTAKNELGRRGKKHIGPIKFGPRPKGGTHKGKRDPKKPWKY